MKWHKVAKAAVCKCSQECVNDPSQTSSFRVLGDTLVLPYFLHRLGGFDMVFTHPHTCCVVDTGGSDAFYCYLYIYAYRSFADKRLEVWLDMAHAEGNNC